MTDQEINRAVAEARGAYVYHYDKDYRENCYYLLLDGDGNTIVPFDPALGIRTGNRATEAQAWADAPDVANDPAAWGALFEECAKRGLNPEIAAVGDKFRAAVGPRRRRIVPLEPAPGRALALAFLMAVGR